MTNAGFLERYQMLQQVGDGPVRSFHAMAGTGVVVMLHFLEGSEEANNALLALVDRLKPNERKRVLDVTAVDGKPVIVTRFILDFRSLEEWLRAHQLKDAPTPSAVLESIEPRIIPPAEPAPPPPPAAKAPGDFTLMFSKPDTLPEAPRRESSDFTREFSALKGDPQPAPTPSPPIQPPSSTGEFTGVFRAELPGKPMGGGSPPPQPTVAPPPVAQPPAPPAPVVPDLAQQTPPPGDFTQMFRADLVNARPPEPAAAPPVFPGPVSPSGSATRSFEAPPPQPPTPSSPPQQPTSDTGFTQLFSAPSPEKRYTAPSFGGPAEPPKSNVPSDNYLNRLGSPGATSRPNSQPTSGPPAFEPNWGTPPAPPAPVQGQAFVPPPVLPPPSNVGPSEYTRVISQPGFDPRSLMSPGGYVPAPPPSAAPTSAPPKTPKIVIIGLIAVVVIAVGTVLFFVLK